MMITALIPVSLVGIHIPLFRDPLVVLPPERRARGAEPAPRDAPRHNFVLRFVAREVHGTALRGSSEAVVS